MPLKTHKELLSEALTLALEGSANGILGVLSMSGTNVDIFGGAIAFTVVIYAIFNRAINALDVLFALSRFVHHYNDPFIKPIVRLTEKSIRG